MSINKYGIVNVLKVNYELAKNDENFRVGFEVLLKHLLWYLDEKLDENGELKSGVGKHVRQKFWSDNAIELFNNRSSNKTKNLLFEHVVPLSLIKLNIIEMLENDASVSDIIEFIDTHLVVCIITKEEDDLLNKLGFKTSLGTDLHESNIWNRYKQAGIKVCTVEVVKKGRTRNINIIDYLQFHKSI